MTENEYLELLLKNQTLSPGSPELVDLQEKRAAVDEILLQAFPGCEPTLRYGGSRAKGTMIKVDYDLDIICYFPFDESQCGETLEDIYYNVRDALSPHFLVQEKTSAIRLRRSDDVDIHIDVVPGRFTDESQTDTFLHQRLGDKQRLKTNIQVHIDHIAKSGVRDAIRVMKLWRHINDAQVRTFPLELLVIELLDGKKGSDLATQVRHVLEKMADSASFHIEDPANPYGNDLSSIFDDSTKSQLASIAGTTLQRIESYGWEHVFGPIEGNGRESVVDLQQLAATAVKTRPWSTDE